MSINQHLPYTVIPESVYKVRQVKNFTNRIPHYAFDKHILHTLEQYVLTRERIEANYGYGKFLGQPYWI